MPVYKDPVQSENTISYGAGIAFVCCLSCVSVMLKFGGFKASLNFHNDKRKSSSREIIDFGSTASVTGAYRINRDEFFGYNYTEGPKQRITAAVVPLPSTEQPETPLRKVKSSSDLTRNKNLPLNLQQETTGISLDPRGAEVNEPRTSKRQENGKNKEKKLDAQKKVEKQRLVEQKKIEKRAQAEQKKIEKHAQAEQKKLEKQRLEEEKKQKRLALQEQAKQEKLRKEREKKEAQQAKKDKKNKKVPDRPLANPLAQASTSASTNPLGQPQTQFSTNTLESSISKSSGPPPYTDVPKTQKPEGESDNTGNVTYSKPIDTGSWDLISQHRQQIINRPTNTAPTKTVKQTMIDLNYKGEENENKDNSEA